MAKRCLDWPRVVAVFLTAEQNILNAMDSSDESTDPPDYREVPSPGSVTIFENCTINSLHADNIAIPDHYTRGDDETTPSPASILRTSRSRPSSPQEFEGIDSRIISRSSSMQRPCSPSSEISEATFRLPKLSRPPLGRETSEIVKKTTETKDQGPTLCVPNTSSAHTEVTRSNVRFSDEASPSGMNKKEESDGKEETVVLKKRKRSKKFEVVSHTSGPKRGKKSCDCKNPLTEETKELKLQECITVKLEDRVCEGSKIFKGVHHGRCEEVIAVKIITKYTKENQEEVKNLKSASENENVVNYYCSGFCNYRGKSAIYIAMELCDIATLEKRIKNPSHQRSFPEKVDEILQIAKGLDHLHNTCRILHRDLKPPNILYKDRLCKISDFGLSKRMLPGKSNTRQSMANIGTDGWRAPETSDTEANSSPASDIYGLGLIFYYDLTDGQHPFGPDENIRQFYIRENRRMSLTACDSMPDGKVFKDLISWMLSFGPKDRPDIKSVLEHPAFWSIRKKINLFDAIVKYEEYREGQAEQNKRALRSGRSASAFNPSSLAQKLDERSGTYGKQVLRMDWINELKLTESERKKFQRGGKEPNAYCLKKKAKGKKGKATFDGSSVFSAIKFIRNRDQHHFHDRALEDFAMTEEEFWEFYSHRFPWLFIYAYTVLKKCLRDKSVDNHLKEVFKEYL